MPDTPSTPNLPDDPDETVEQARGARLGARVALLAFLALSSLFVASSTWQLTRAVFFEGSEGAARNENGGSSGLDAKGPCARELRRLATAVDRGLEASSLASTDTSALQAFDSGIARDWGSAPEAATLCKSEPDGTNAYAAVERLRTAAVAFARHRATDLAKVRHEVTSELGR